MNNKEISRQTEHVASMLEDLLDKCASQYLEDEYLGEDEMKILGEALDILYDTAYYYGNIEEELTEDWDDVPATIDSVVLDIPVEDKVETELETPQAGPDAGIASEINKLIIDEWDTIQSYNDAIISAKAEGFEDIVKVLNDIQNEENVHVGQLEQALKTLAPSTEKIGQGEVEGQEQIEQGEEIVQ